MALRGVLPRRSSFTDTLVNKHVGVNRHTDVEDEPAIPGSVSVALIAAIIPRTNRRWSTSAPLAMRSAIAVIDHHEIIMSTKPKVRLYRPCAPNPAPGKGDDTLLDNLDRSREGAGAKHHGQVLGLIHGKAAFRSARVPTEFWTVMTGAEYTVLSSYDCQVFSNVGGGDAGKRACAFTVHFKLHDGLSMDIPRGRWIRARL